MRPPRQIPTICIPTCKVLFRVAAQGCVPAFTTFLNLKLEKKHRLALLPPPVDLMLRRPAGYGFGEIRGILRGAGHREPRVRLPDVRWVGWHAAQHGRPMEVTKHSLHSVQTLIKLKKVCSTYMMTILHDKDQDY